ncbi:protein NYNRIN-like [Gossypium australe]|uniref:Protein NYNRIN-like n=1 Tax=Gossypium australe TaxID=47621 RepID=A0A5B6X3R3_9ROSI|nr:protein NYNRIN-like [Gossypium australe]
MKNTLPLLGHIGRDDRSSIITNQPIKEVLSKVDTSGRVTNWSIELGKFGIYFSPWTAIKG